LNGGYFVESKKANLNACEQLDLLFEFIDGLVQAEVLPVETRRPRRTRPISNSNP